MTLQDDTALNVGVFEASTEEGSVIEGNLLKGNLDERMTGDVGTFYVLTKIAQSEVGFRLNGADTGVRQYGAYIPVLSGIASAVLRFEGDASGIFCIENDVDGHVRRLCSLAHFDDTVASAMSATMMLVAAAPCFVSGYYLYVTKLRRNGAKQPLFFVFS